MRSVLRFLLFVWLLEIPIQRVAASEQNPSVAVALSKAGLQFFSNVGHKIVNHELPKIPFPDIAFPINNGPGTGYVSVHGLRIPKLQSPLFHFQLSPPDGINWVTEGGTVKLAGRWKANYTFLTTFYLHGWVQVLASDIRSNVTLSAYGKDGHPQVDVHGCEVDVLDLHLSLGGGVIQWIVNLFKSDLSYAVKEMIHSQFCGLMKSILIQRANDALRTLPKHVDVTGDVFLDYELERQPVRVSENSVLGRAYVDVMLGNRTCPLPTVELKIGEINHEYMANIWLSETAFNCLLFSAHESRMLHFVINRNLYSKLETFLATDCHFLEICVGKFFPQMREKYPGRHVQLNFYSTQPPVIRLVQNSSAQVDSKFFIDLQIQPEKGKPNITDTLARIGELPQSTADSQVDGLEMNLHSTVQPAISNARVCGTVNSTDLRLVEVFSHIGDISASFLDTLQLLLEPVIKVSADTVLRLGIPIPLVENLSLTNRTQVFVTDRAIRVNTDLVYTNTTLPTEAKSRNVRSYSDFLPL